MVSVHQKVAGGGNLCPLTSVGELESRVVPPRFRWTFVYVKAILAKPWNRMVKPWLKTVYRKQRAVKLNFFNGDTLIKEQVPDITVEKKSEVLEFKSGDLVRVKTRFEIDKTLNPFHELKGCAFLESMYQYCDTVQCINTRVERFLDERSYQVKSSKGLYFLDDLICTGTTVFGRCDRRCYYFWRIEWLEPI